MDVITENLNLSLVLAFLLMVYYSSIINVMTVNKSVSMLK